MRKSNLIRVAALLAVFGAFGATRAAAYRVYGAPCGNPAGLPGFLVKMHFIPKGSCDVNLDGSCKNSAACNSSLSGTSKGKCTTSGSGKTLSCACVI